jgi:hypothetical protein
VRATLALALLAPSAGTLHAQLLTFEGVGNDVEVGTFYSSSGITFTSNAFALTRTNAGGSGNFGGNPSGITAVVFSDLPGTPAYLDVSGGFMTGLSLFYSAPGGPVTVRVYSGLGATGSLLATLLLAGTPNGSIAGCPANPGATFCPFAMGAATFAGTARSVDFSSALNDATFDDIRLGAAQASVIPEPATVTLVASGLLGLAAVARRRRLRHGA